LAWRPEGYGQRFAAQTDLLVEVLTPRSIVKTLARGFAADVHPSAL
jgi:hypothetical protein